jgi:hypothetical protein
VKRLIFFSGLRWHRANEMGLVMGLVTAGLAWRKDDSTLIREAI